MHAPTARLYAVILPPALIFLVSALLSEPMVLATYTVIGTAHFFMTFLHHFRTGKMHTRYRWVALALLVVACAYFGLGGGFYPVTFFAGLIFAIHFVLGEYRLRSETPDRVRTLSLIGFVLTTTYVVVMAVLPALIWYANLILAVAMLVALSRLMSTVVRPLSEGERYLLFIQVLMLTLIALGVPLGALGGLLVTHVYTWTWYGGMLARTRGMARKYWVETIVFLLIMAGGYGVFLAYPFSVLGILFLPSAYYYWSIVHIALTTRFALRVSKK